MTMRSDANDLPFCPPELETYLQGAQPATATRVIPFCQT